jgi:hypothetical protein
LTGAAFTMKDDVHVETCQPVSSREGVVGPVDLGFMFLAMIAAVVSVVLSFDLMAVFTPFRIFALAAGLEWLVIRACRLSVSFRDERLSLWLFVAAVAAMFLAGHLAPHYAGGQDQGYYTAMAEMMARGEPVDFFDRFRASLPADLGNIYENTPVWSVFWMAGGKAYLGFYPLHPAMMALSAQLLGPGKHTVWLLVAFVVIIVALYTLTYELSAGDKRAASLAAALAAVNPAFVFFAKFPVSEMTAAALTLPAGYHLLQGYRSANDRSMIYHGFAAALLMTGFFFTRMSFPVLATFLLALVLIVFMLPTSQRQKIFLGAAIGVFFALYATSLLFYYIKQPILFRDVIEQSYLPALWQGRWLLVGAAAAGVAVLIALAVPTSRIRFLPMMRAAIEVGARRVLPFPALLMAVLSVPSLYVLLHNGSLGPFGDSPLPPGLALLRLHPLYVFTLFVSPFLLLLLIARRAPQVEGRDVAETLPALFLVVCWPVTLTFAGVIPYLYYYGRYLFEVLPVAIIAIALAARSSWLPNGLVRVLVSLGVAWMLAFSLVQLNLAEGEAERPFHRIAERMKPGDVLAIDGGEITEAIRSYFLIPLRYAFGLPTFIIPPGSEAETHRIIDRLRAATAGSLYVLSQTELATTPAGAARGVHTVDHVQPSIEMLRVDENSRRAWLLPFRVSRVPRVTASVFLSEVPRIGHLAYALGDTVSMGRDGYGFAYVGEGWSGQEEKHRWSIGDRASLVLRLEGDPPVSAPLRLTMLAWTLGGQNVELEVNGKRIGRRFVKESTEQIEFSIPAGLVQSDRVEIVFRTPEAKSPSSLGRSGDTRVLGIAVQWFRLEAVP